MGRATSCDARASDCTRTHLLGVPQIVFFHRLGRRIGATENFESRSFFAFDRAETLAVTLSTAPGSLARQDMQGFDALRAALNPFSLAQRRKVPAGHGRGRQIVFAVDSSSFRLVSPAPCETRVVAFHDER